MDICMFHSQKSFCTQECPGIQSQCSTLSFALFFNYRSTVQYDPVFSYPESIVPYRAQSRPRGGTPGDAEDAPPALSVVHDAAHYAVLSRHAVQTGVDRGRGSNDLFVFACRTCISSSTFENFSHTK